MSTLLGTMVRDARERAELSLNQTARRAGIGTSYLSQIERGEIKTPGAERLKKIAHVLELDPIEVLEAAGRLTVEQQLLLEKRPSFSEFVHSDPRLDRQAARALVALYMHFTGGRE